MIDRIISVMRLILRENTRQAVLEGGAPVEKEKITDRELRKLSRADLLELLVAESRENERLRARLNEANRRLKNREIKIQKAGSIAEAALRLNGVFEAAEQAALQYLDNIRRLSEEASREKERATVAEAEDRQEETAVLMEDNSEAKSDVVEEQGSEIMKEENPEEGIATVDTVLEEENSEKKLNN